METYHLGRRWKLKKSATTQDAFTMQSEDFKSSSSMDECMFHNERLKEISTEQSRLTEEELQILTNKYGLDIHASTKDEDLEKILEDQDLFHIDLQKSSLVVYLTICIIRQHAATIAKPSTPIGNYDKTPFGPLRLVRPLPI